MPDLILKNIPDDLYVQLIAAAKTHQRSPEDEALYCIRRVLNPHKADMAYHVAAAKALRAATDAKQQ